MTATRRGKSALGFLLLALSAPSCAGVTEAANQGFDITVGQSSASLTPCTAHTPTFCGSGSYSVDVPITVTRHDYAGDITMTMVPTPSGVNAYYGPAVIPGTDNAVAGSGAPRDKTVLYLSVFTFGSPFDSADYGRKDFTITASGADGTVRTAPFSLTITR